MSAWSRRALLLAALSAAVASADGPSAFVTWFAGDYAATNAPGAWRLDAEGWLGFTPEAERPAGAALEVRTFRASMRPYSSRAALPHTFKGAARAFGGTVAVSFDEPSLAAYFANGGQPIRLLEGVEGALTGAWTFELPEGCAENWDIRTVRGPAGILAYDLLWREPGMVLLVR